MLTLLDKYIIRKFLTTFFFMLGIIMLLAMVFDISERLSEFISNDAPISDVFLKYYLNFILFYGNTFSPMIVFVSVIWFTAKMAQESEIIPMMFSGRPFLRIVRPYMIAATILMLLSLVLNHFILPRANEVRLNFEEQFYRDRMYVENYHAEFPGNTIVYFKSYVSDDNLISEFKIEKWNKKNELESFLFAKTAKNEMGTTKWKLNNYYVRHVGKPNDRIETGLSKDTILNLHIEEMAMRDNRSETMTYTELKDFIRREKEKGSSKVPNYEIELYQRTSYPFATYILTLIGIAVSSRKTRGGIGASIAIGLGFVFIYIFAMKVTTVAAINVGFPSYLAVWIPNIIFGLVGLYLYRIAPK
jgi:lipopolysaccharide export system permease protein